MRSAMSFINAALPVMRRYPNGVSYHTCPFLNVSLDPILAVHPDTVVRGCLADNPSEVRGTHGGFHRQTTLLTSNIIGLIDRLLLLLSCSIYSLGLKAFGPPN